jgi:hypothetical protein
MRLTRRPLVAHRLSRDESGVALIEFAFAVPLLLILGMGGTETANYAIANLRVSQIAMTVADNAGRVRTALDENDVNDIMSGAKAIGSGIDFATNGRVILSGLEQRTTTTGGAGPTTTTNPNGYRQFIRWQRCAGALRVTSSYGGPTNSGGSAVTNLDNKDNADHGAVEGASTITSMGDSDNPISAATGTAVMFAEVFYTYQPVTPIGLFRGQVIHMNQAFNVRERTAQSISNLSGLSGNRRSDCRLFDKAVPVLD